MSVNLSPVAGAAAQFLDNSGNVLTGGKLYTYLAGTTTPAATYTSSTGTQFHTNPIILDAAGRVSNGGEIWLADNVSYKFVLKDANDVLIGTWDNLTGINSNFVNYTSQEEIIVATAGQTVFNLSTVTYVPGTNSLQVFVDGVNQYDGITYAYVETDATTVTFTAGLHVGALVKFTTAVSVSAGTTNANLVIYDPAGAGAVSTTVQAKLREIVNIKDFGAIGDGVTDDTLAIQSAADYCNQYNANDEQRPFLYGASGTYLVTNTITLSCNGDLSDALFVADGSAVSPVIRFGGNTSGTYAYTKDIKLPRVNNTSRVAGTWGSGTGISLDNCDQCIITVPQVTNFETGLDCGGYDQNFAYNIVNLQLIYSNKINIKVGAKNAGGACNQNLFNGGRLGINTTDFTTSGYVGTRDILIGNSFSNANNNIFINTSLETALIEYSIEFRQKTAYNTFQSCRYEGVGAKRVLFNTDVASGNSSNLFIGGYQADQIVITEAGVGTNVYNALITGRENKINSSGNCFSLTTGSAANPHIQGFNAGQDSLTKSNTSTDWTYRLNAGYLQAKRSTDAFPRIDITYSSSAIVFGDGTAAPTVGFQSSGLTYLYLVGSPVAFAPVVNNVTSLGAAGYRWSEVFATNGTINTSDEREKQQIRTLSDAEKAVAIKIKSLLRAFKFNDAVVKKGDKARIHFGVMAQEVGKAFKSEGLNANDYSLFCYDEWEATPEILAEDGAIVTPAKQAGNIYGIRYEELLAFIIAAI